ncbi:MAG: hypothetical protein ACYDBH_10105 [Acidobacteriaceae bacterium]
MENIIAIDKFSALHEALSSYRDNKRRIFREHSDPTCELKPKVGRAHKF